MHLTSWLTALKTLAFGKRTLRRVKKQTFAVGASGSEFLEDRCLLSTFHVALTGNDGNDGSAGTPFRTVQAAIAAASANNDGTDAIRVAAGTYNSLNVDGRWSIADNPNLSNLTISGGWDAGFTTQTPQSTIYIPNYTPAPVDGNGGDIDILDANTTIQGFHFAFDGNLGGTGDTRASGGIIVQSTGITIENNAIEIGGNPNSGVRSAAIQTASVDTSNLLITNNTITADGASLSNGLFFGPGVGTNTRVVGNTISGTSFATIITINQRGDISIADNTIQRNIGAVTTFQAITVRGGASATPLTGISITGNTIDGGGTGTGIHISSIAGAVQPITGFEILNNVISNHAGSAGIVIGAGVSQANNISGTIAYNSITGNFAGLNTIPAGAGSNNIDASRNWWGQISGPTVAANPGGLGQPINDAAGIDFAPWLIYSPDTNPSLPGVQLPTTVTVTPGGDISAADNDFTRLQNAIGAAAPNQTIDIQGNYNWLATAASTAYLASTNTSATNDIRGVEIPANVSNLTITSSDSSAQILGQGDVADGIFDAFLFTDDGVNSGNSNLTISQLKIDDFENAIMMGWNVTGVFQGTQIVDNQITLGGDNDGLQNIAIYLAAGTNQLVSGNTVTFQADGTLGATARSFGIQNNTTGGTLYSGLVIDGNTFTLGASSNGVETVTGIWENGHNDNDASLISITNNQFLGRQGVDLFDRGLMLTSQTAGLLVDGNVFVDVDNVFFARNAAGGTEVGDSFTFSNSQLTRVGGADGIFLQNVTTDAIPVHVAISWNVNNTVDGFTGIRGLNELSVQATGASRPLSGAADLDVVTAVGVRTNVFVDDDSTGAARFTDPDGIGSGFGPAATGFNSFATVAEGIDAVDVGGTVNVAAGTYAENLLVNKSLTLQGPNSTIDPNTGVRVGEAVLVPAATETSLQGSTSGVIVRVGSPLGHVDVTIDGFTIDGHNSSLTSGRVLNGVEVHTGAGIANSIGSFDTNPGGYDATLNVQNNIIRNLERYGVLIDNVPARTPTAGNDVSHNQIDNLPSGDNFGGGRGRAAAFEENVYGTFSYNVVTRVNVGWQDDNYSQASPGAGTLVDHNTISAYHRGIFHNLQYQDATPATISNNTISAETQGDFPATNSNFGIELASIQGTVGATVSNNNITGNVFGILLWGNTTTGVLDITGGTLTGNQYGIYATNNDPQFGAASGTSQASVSGVSIVNPTVAGIALDSTANSSPVTLSIGSGISISGGPVGLLVNGPDTGLVGDTLSNLAFSGQAGNYITLANGALDNDTIAANAATFDGLSPSTMTPAQLFALENKILHEVDDPSLGLIETTPGVFFVSPATTPTATDNDYTRLANLMAVIGTGDTVTLSGTFDWTEVNAAASWALGNDGLAGTGDDYSLLAPADLNDVTWTSASLGAARIQGPGDLAGVNLEGVFYFDGTGDNQNWTISNLEIFDFDLAIGFFFGAGGPDAYNDTTITNNAIRVPADLNATVAPVDVNQNIGIHYSFGTNQTISNNVIEIVGSGLSDGLNLSSSVGMQSNTSGGAVYDGLLIDNNTITVTGNSSAQPSFVRGFWENSAAHLSDITVSNNEFVNLTGDNADVNQMQAFVVTSHSSATTTVAYNNNVVTGASVGFQWIAGNNFTGNLPVQLTGNQITNTQTGVLIQSNGLASLSGNTLDGIGGTSVGLQILAGSTADLFRNEISGSNVGIDNSGTLTFATENFVRNNSADGIRINASGQVTGTIFNNDLSGNSGLSVNNLGAGLVNASGNAFGVTNAADVASEVFGNVDYSPWLNVSTDIDVGTTGFQGDFSSLGVDASSAQSTFGGLIQEAVNWLSDGTQTGADRTIHIAAGTYAEAANLYIPLTLVLEGNASVDSLDSIAQATIDLQSHTLTVGDGSVNNTLAGPIEGTGNLIKHGSGTLTLSGASTFSGTTTVSAGTLLVTGTTTSATTVENSATLSGSGSITGPVTVNSGGNLIPGNPLGDLQTGALTLAAGSSFTVEVNGSMPGSQADQVVVNGTVNVTGATLTTSGTITAFPGQEIVLIANDGTDAVIGTFAGRPEGSIVNVNGIDFVLSYQGGTGNDVTLQETPVVVSINDVLVNESAGTLVFTLTLDRALDIDITVDVSFLDDTATGGGVDYDSTVQSVTFTAGQTTAQVTVPIVDDSLVEATEAFTAVLSTATNLGGRSVDLSDTGAGVITDNDVATVSITAKTDGAEGTVPTNGSVTVTLSSASSTDTVVNYTVSGSATSGSDYTVLTGAITIPAGQTSAVIDISVLDDAIVEGTETVIVTLSNLGAHDPNIALSGTPADLTTSVIITDDDSNTLTISSPTVTEGNSGTTLLTFTVTSPNAVQGGFTVDFNVSDVSTNGADYTVITTSPLTFAGVAGETQTVTVEVVGDTLVEGDETFTVTLGTVATVAPVSAASVISGAVGTGTILNDDGSLLTINSPSVTEGDSGTTIVTFTVTSPQAVDGGFTVEFSIANLTANSSDYTVITSSPLTFSGTAGETQTITIEVNGDSIVEGDETFTVTLGIVTPVDPVQAGSITTGTVGTGTIINDDSTTLSISSPTVTEGNAGTSTLTFVVTSSNAVEGGFSVDFDLADLTTDGVDYTLVTTSPLTFSGIAGETQTITVNVNGDTTVETDETFSVTLGVVTPVAPVSASDILSGATGVGTITNDDSATVSLVATSDGAETDTPSNGKFTVTLSTASATETVVSYTVTGTATAGGDYTTLSGSVTIPAGQTSADIDVSVLNDDIVEAAETVTVTLTAITSGDASVTLDSTPANLTDTISITDNDTATFTINNVTVDEATGNLIFDLVSDKALDIDITIDVTFADGTATGGGVDYASTAQSVTFLAGQTSKQISVAIADDAVVESDETFTASLSTTTPLAGRNIDLSDTATGTITDNDTATFTINNVTVNEGDGSLTFDIVTNHALDVDVTITVTFSDVTATGNGTDYASVTQQVTFLAGETAKQVTVAINDDNIVEGTETFVASLSTSTALNGRNVELVDTATGIIVDNDGATVSIAQATDGAESNSPVNGKFTVTLSTPSATDTVINYTVSGTAIAGADYTTLSGSVTILAGQTTADIDIAVLNDGILEPDETVIVTLTGIEAGDSDITISPVAGDVTATVVITDDDINTLSISSSTVLEGNAGTTTLTFTVTSPNEVQGGFTVAFNVANLTASGTDYFVVTSSPLTFTGVAGETQTITVNVIGDTIVEPDETFTLTLGEVVQSSTAVASRIVTGAVGTGTIIDDDTNTLVISSPTVTEGNAGTTTLTFTVTSPNAVQGGFTVAFNVSDITTSGADYSVVTVSPLTFSGTAGETQTITVNVVGDTIVEADETFSVTLGEVNQASSAVESRITTGAVGTGTITDDDVNVLVISSPVITEGNSGTSTLTFTVTSPNAVQGGFTVAFNVADLTAGATDYTVVTTSPLAFTGTAGETQTITVNVIGDTIVEADETLSVTLGEVDQTSTAVEGRITTGAVGTGTILDDDFNTLVISSPVVTEGDAGTTTLTFTVTSPNAVQGGFSVAFSVADLTTSGTDYTVVTSSPLVFTGSAGETQTITVSVVGDTIVEADETFSVTLGAVDQASAAVEARIISGASGTGTITNDDSTTLTISNVSLVEGNSGTSTLTFTVTSANAVEGGFSVAFNVADITTNGADYTVVTSGPLTFTGVAGETQTITITVNGDTVIEPDETLSVTLGAVTPLGIVDAADIVSGASGTGAIINDDTAVVSIAKINDGAELNTPVDGKFRVTLSTVSPTDTVVTYTVTGTATPGVGQDYATLTGTVTIPAGQLSADIDVSVFNDTVVEGTETVIVTLTGLTANDPAVSLDSNAGNLTATVNITDNDPPVISSAATATVVENTPVSTVVLDVNADPIPGETFTYSLSGPDAALFNINPATGEITFAASPDFEAPADQGANNVYNVTVTVSSSSNPTRTATQDVTITVTGVNDATPVFNNASPTFSLAENSVVGTSVGTVSATDGDVPSENLTYSIVSGNESGAFAINPSTGEITVADATKLDFETTASFSLLVRVTDNGSPTPRTADAMVVVNLTNVEEGPVITLPNPQSTYQLRGPATIVSPDATFSYGVANPDFSNAILTVSIVNGRDRRDRLSIARKGDGSGGITARGRKVFADGVQIGTFKGGRGQRNPNLVVTLNGNANSTNVQNLLRRVTFQAKAGAGTTRTINMQVRNVSGADSNVAAHAIVVN